MSDKVQDATTNKVSGTFTRKTKHKPYRMLAGVTAVGLASTGLLVTTPAYADPGYSESSAQYLSGSLLNTGLDNVAELEGVNAEVPFTGTETVTETNNLNLNVLGDTINLELPNGLEIPIDTTNAGVVGQYAQAEPTGDARAASGLVGNDGAVDVAPDPANPPGNLTLDLTDLLGDEITSEIANLNLETGVNTATAEQVLPGEATGDYNIADLTLNFNSEAVSNLATNIDAASTPLEETVDAAVGPDGSIANSILGLLDVVPGVTESEVSLDVDLDTVVNNVITENQILGENGSVTVNLATGEVSVDVAQLLTANGRDLNNLPADSEILNAEIVTFVTAEIDELVKNLLDEVNEEVRVALDLATLNINIVAGDPAAPVLSVQTSAPLSDIASGETNPDVTVAGIDLPIGIVRAALQGSTQALQNLTVETEGLLAPITEDLNPALDDVLTDVISLTANVQETENGTFTETALRLTLLEATDVNGELLQLNLAQASVGPNALVIDPANPDTILVDFTPKTGPEAGGTPVTIVGTGFTGATQILFGTTPATTFTVVSDTEIRATSPAGTGAVPLTISGTQYGNAVSTDNFTYIPNGNPSQGAIATITPTEGPEAGGTPVIITGNGFTGATNVNFGNTPATTFTVVSDTEIRATSPAGTGAVNLTIVGTTTNGDITSTNPFTYIAPTTSNPVIDTITPAEGPEAGGTTVTIIGTGFTGTTQVLFGDTPATSYTIISDTEIQAVAPAGTGSVAITVVEGSEEAISSDLYTYIPENTDGTDNGNGNTPAAVTPNNTGTDNGANGNGNGNGTNNAADTQRAGNLASTGSNALTLGGIGLMALLSGGLLFAFRKKFGFNL